MSNSHSLKVWTRPLELGCAGCGCHTGRCDRRIGCGAWRSYLYRTLWPTRTMKNGAGVEIRLIIVSETVSESILGAGVEILFI